MPSQKQPNKQSILKQRKHKKTPTQTSNIRNSNQPKKTNLYKIDKPHKLGTFSCFYPRFQPTNQRFFQLNRFFFFRGTEGLNWKNLGSQTLNPSVLGKGSTKTMADLDTETRRSGRLPPTSCKDRIEIFRPQGMWNNPSDPKICFSVMYYGLKKLHFITIWKKRWWNFHVYVRDRVSQWNWIPPNPLAKYTKLATKFLRWMPWVFSWKRDACRLPPFGGEHFFGPPLGCLTCSTPHAFLSILQ